MTKGSSCGPCGNSLQSRVYTELNFGGIHVIQDNPNPPGTYYKRALGALVPYIAGTWEVRVTSDRYSTDMQENWPSGFSTKASAYSHGEHGRRVFVPSSSAYSYWALSETKPN